MRECLQHAFEVVPILRGVAGADVLIARLRLGEEVAAVAREFGRWRWMGTRKSWIAERISVALRYRN
jgi:hypothetical protein